MEKDIFAEYIKNIQSERLSSLPYKKPEVKEVQDQPESAHTLAVLKEISQKLDGIQGRTPSYNFDEDVDLAIVGGMVVMPDCGVFPMDLYIKGGKICTMGKQDRIHAKRTMDASGKYVCPGIIDPHVHLGLFAPMETDMVSETKAAIMGGVTTIGMFCGGGQSHFTSFPEIEEQASRFSYTDIVPHLVISNEEQKRELKDYARYLGVTSFKVYMNGIPGMIPSVDDGFIMDVFAEMKQTGKECILCCHTENTHLVARALRNAKEKYAGTGDIEQWPETHPAIAEEEAVIRIAYLAEKAKVPVYLVHIGTKESVERLRQLKPYNQYLNIETTSPYLSVAGTERKDALYKMEPPLREQEDKDALWKAVADGIVDTIGTDNVCETKGEKQPELPIWEVVPGYSVLETHLASVMTEGVVKRGIDIEKIITHMTKKPAQTFGIYPQKGSLLPGSDADIVLIDMSQEREVRAVDLSSRSDFTIYEGRRLKGWPCATIKGGKVVMENGILTEAVPTGKMLKR